MTQTLHSTPTDPEFSALEKEIADIKDGATSRAGQALLRQLERKREAWFAACELPDVAAPSPVDSAPSEKPSKLGLPPPNKGKKYPPEPLTVEEVRALLASCSRRAPTGVRNRALVTILWRAGLRIAEALALRPADVDLAAGTLRILHGKGDKSRLAGLDPEGCAVLST